MEFTFYNRDGQPYCYCLDDEHLYTFGGAADCLFPWRVGLLIFREAFRLVS